MARSRKHSASPQQQLSLDAWAETVKAEHAAEITASDPKSVVHRVSIKAGRRGHAAAVTSAGSPAEAASATAAPKTGGSAQEELSKHARRHQATRGDKAAETASVVDTTTLLTTSEAARLLRVHPRTVQRLVGRGELRAVYLGGAVRFDPHDVGALVERVKHSPAAPAAINPVRARRFAARSFAERLRSSNDEHRAAQT
jgi:excisionase family DNA binding protein